jgi:hypothetical protein
MRLLSVVFLTLSLGSLACNQTTAEAPGTNGESSAVATTGTTAAGGPAAWHEVTIPAGTTLPIVLDMTVGSDTSRVEEPVTAHVSRAIMVDGVSALPEGTRISGVVTDATHSGKVEGRAHVGMRFDSLVPSGSDERYRIETAAVERTAAATKKDDALKIGGSAAGGALIGALVGGKKGALIGTGVGGGAGTAVVLSTKGKEIHLARGAALTLRLNAPVKIRVRG